MGKLAQFRKIKADQHFTYWQKVVEKEWSLGRSAKVSLVNRRSTKESSGGEYIALNHSK